MSSPWIVAVYQAGLILGDRTRVQAAAQVMHFSFSHRLHHVSLTIVILMCNNCILVSSGKGVLACIARVPLFCLLSLLMFMRSGMGSQMALPICGTPLSEFGSSQEPCLKTSLSFINGAHGGMPAMLFRTEGLRPH